MCENDIVKRFSLVSHSSDICDNNSNVTQNSKNRTLLEIL